MRKQVVDWNDPELKKADREGSAFLLKLNIYSIR